jgi:fibronectin type 3 domain-containing protein
MIDIWRAWLKGISLRTERRPRRVRWQQPLSAEVFESRVLLAATLDFSGGFAGSAGVLTYNGSAAINGAKLELTNGTANQVGSAFSSSAVDVTKFNTQFTFQLTAGANTADGFTFTIQGVGPTAIGSGGGGLGYGTDGTTGTARIGSSVAIKFDLYNNAGEGVDSTGLYTNGADPTTAGSVDLTGSGIDLHSGNPIRANLSYDGTTLTVLLTDTVTNSTATQTYTVNIPSFVGGGGTAYVGFTGSDGGVTATQDITNWRFTSGTAIGAPSGLTAQALSASSVSLTWTNNTIGQTGLILDRATDVNFTQNLVTQNLPASSSSFTDTATGISPGGTYYYRIRATTSGGNSSNSATAVVGIPLGATNVLSYHNDLGSTGANTTETALNPSNVVPGASFAKLYSTAVDGQVYAQPLVDTGVTIAVGPNTTTGSAGVHNVVFVATEHDSLYAIDAVTGAILWKRSFLKLSDALPNATAITSVPNSAVNSTDITPEIGITGTPVIDATNNLLYVVTKTAETVGGVTHYVQRLHAINLADGTDKVSPYLIGDTTFDGTNYTNNTQIYVYGTGTGNTIDPYNGTGKQVVQFNALREHQRAALSLVNGTVYVAWASHSDSGPYHGWVVGWNVSNLTTQGFILSGVLNTSPNHGNAGIWEGSGKLAFEADGSAFYFETGNGIGNNSGTTLGSNGFPIDGNYYDALVKVVADPTTTATSQTMNGWGFKIVDFFIPYNQQALDTADQDFGSGGPTLLPDSAGIAGHPHLMIAGGKDGRIYLIDRDNLGRFDPNGDHVVNAVPNGLGQNTAPKLVNGLVSTAAYFNGKVYAASGYNGSAYEITINADGTTTDTAQTAITAGFLPGSPSISASGTNNGIVWLTERNANQLHAFDATNMTELWNSGMNASDAVGAVIKFAVPTVADGQVFVGTSNSLVVYGLEPPSASVPLAPSLSGSVLSSTSVQLNWTDGTVAPNIASGYKIDISTDGTNFTPATTAPAGALGIALGGLTPLKKYYFRVRGYNVIGDSPNSNVITLTTTNQSALLNYSGGFAGSSTSLKYNGSATINGSKLELTNGATGERGSVFSMSLVDITKFSSQFTFQTSAGANTGEGLTFTIQGVGPKAQGSSGSGLGYGGTTGSKIRSSVAIKFDLHNNAGEGPDSTGLYTNGALPTNSGSINLTGTGIDLHSGHPIQANLTYDGTTLTVLLTDTVTQATATQNYTVNISSFVGGGTAYVGFTGSTGSTTATQDILNWTFSPSAQQAPAAPSALGAVPASATSVALTWTNNATNQTGFILDRAADAAFTQNLISQNLPASPNSFTDTASGLNPAGTYYYRIRAVNAAGPSANSTPVSVTIPVAPVTPTNATVTGVTSSEIDLSWTDNAGPTADGYYITRGVNGGAQVLYATLPALGYTFPAKPPGTYTWSDTNVNPGTLYEYHIEAFNVSGYNDFTGTSATTLTTAPGGLTATGVAGAVNLSWTAPTGAVSYNIYRGTTSGGETLFQSGVTATSFSDATGTAGTTYFYTVTAVNSNATRVPALPAESAASAEVSAASVATAPFTAHINFTKTPATDPVNYVADTGLIYGSRGNGLTYGWNADNTAAARDRNNAISPNELYDSLVHMQAPGDPNAYWGIAVPNGTYLVHLIAGDPSAIDSVYKINVGGTLSGGTISGGTLAISGTPTAAQHWFENSVTVNITGGVLYVSTASGGLNNKIDAIDITRVTPVAAVNQGSGFAGATGLTLSGAAAINGANLQLTSGATGQTSSAFTSNLINVAKFTTSFSFLVNSGAGTGDGFTFTIQGESATALGSGGGSLGYGGIASGGGIGQSVAIKFDLFDNAGEGPNSTGLYINGAAPTNTGSIDLTSSGINLHNGNLMNVTLSYDGTTLTETITDTVTNATFTQQYTINIPSLVGGNLGFVGFTAGTGVASSTTQITSWTYSSP